MSSNIRTVGLISEAVGRGSTSRTTTSTTAGTTSPGTATASTPTHPLTTAPVTGEASHIKRVQHETSNTVEDYVTHPRGLASRLVVRLLRPIMVIGSGLWGAYGDCLIIGLAARVLGYGIGLCS